MKSELEIYNEAENYAKIEKEKRLFGQQVSRCISTEEFQREAYFEAFSKCQKEYEEKLRWIPIEEKMPENLEWVDCKSGVGDHYVGCYLENYGIKTGEPATITHWRSFL